ncbi:MAG: hypothetical protein ACFCUX_01240 [Candidatus Methylacidiphilales bacterium]
MKIKQLTLCVWFIVLGWWAGAAHAMPVELSDQEAQRIGRLIWHNECGGTVIGLTMWNAGEEFPSLGIGHFIWYPSGTTGPYQESFPSMIAYLVEQGVEVPAWVRQAQGCPWPTREAFMKDLHGAQLTELRAMLEKNVAHQARFAARRFLQSLPRILQASVPEHRASLEAKFRLLASDPHGLYALMDYVNFKGEGVNPAERYAGEGWGLLQVLERMPPATNAREGLDSFADAAIAVLSRRIELSPAHRGEVRWRLGWTRRCDSYRISSSPTGQ